MSFVDNLSREAKRQKKEQDAKNKQIEIKQQAEIKQIYESTKLQFVDEIYQRISNTFESVVLRKGKSHGFSYEIIKDSGLFSRTIELRLEFNSTVISDNNYFFYDNDVKRYTCPKLHFKNYYDDSILTAFFGNQSQEDEFIRLLKKKCSDEGINLSVTKPPSKDDYLHDKIYTAKIKIKK